MSTENSQMPEIIVEWIGKRGLRAVGVQTWSTPVLKDRNKPLGRDGRWSEDNVILDCSELANLISLNGSTVEAKIDSAFGQALLQLSGQGTPNGSLWSILKEGDTRQLYRVVKVAERERKSLEDVEERIKYQTKVFSMKDEEINEYALLLGITGRSIASIKNTLGDVYFREGNERLKNTLVHYLDMDDEERMMYVSLLSALKKGNPDLKQGVHQRVTGLYYNERPLGADVKDAIGKIVNAPDRVELMMAIKGFTEASSEKNESKKSSKK